MQQLLKTLVLSVTVAKKKQSTFICRSPWLGHFILQTHFILYQRIISVGNNHNIYHFLDNQPIQSANFKLVADFFCIYIAHFNFNAQKFVKISDNELIRFDFHMMF